jgi:tetratricopeptide (TPR) repeat protein
MRAFLQSHREKYDGLASAIRYGFIVASLALATPAFAAGDTESGSGGDTPSVGAGGGAGGAGGGTGGAGAGTAHPSKNQSGLTTCQPGMVWDAKQKKCLARHSGVLPDSELTEYAYALAKADRYQEAIDVLDLLDNPNTPRALNYRGYATRKLGRTDEGISYYLKSVALDPNYPQVREYLGEAYIVEGKYDLAKDQLAAIEKLCGLGCVYYEDLAEALAQAHAL